MSKKELADEVVAKYKGDLSKAYSEVKGHQSALKVLMNDMLDRQEQLIGMCIHLESYLDRIEQFFLSDTAPSRIIGLNSELDKQFITKE